MSEDVSRDTVAHVAKLARLKLDAAEIDGLATDLGRILEYVARLDELDLSDTPAFTHGDADAAMPFRPDTPKRDVDPAALLENAPDPAEGFFRVPHILAGDE